MSERSTREPGDRGEADARPIAGTRRQILRLGAALCAGMPLVVSLDAREARAAGSWSSPAHAPRGLEPARDERPVIPYSWEWRQRRERERRAAEYYRSRYGGLGEE